MSSPFSRSLPTHPDLTQQKKQAKQLLQSFTAGDADAHARVRTLLPDKQRITLADTQFVLAREYGFANWAAFKQHIEAQTNEQATLERRVRDAFQRCDAGTLRRLFEQHPSLRARI